MFRPHTRSSAFSHRKQSVFLCAVFGSTATNLNLRPLSLYPYMTVPLYLHKVMESLGVLQELREEGAANGDLVLVGEKQIALAEPPENLG